VNKFSKRNPGGALGKSRYSAIKHWGCAVAFKGPYPTVFSGHATAMVISATTFSSGVTNTGTIGPGGISVISGAFISGGGILDTGTVAGGIKVDSSSKIVASRGGAKNAIAVENTRSFGGGISNAGTLSAASSGVFVSSVSTFTGGITNSGLIAGHGGIDVDQIRRFTGGIANAGSISAHVTDVFVRGTVFSGGIVNSGTLISDNGDAASELIRPHRCSGGGLAAGPLNRLSARSQRGERPS
jgi:hypothetical protein